MIDTRECWLVNVDPSGRRVKVLSVLPTNTHPFISRAQNWINTLSNPSTIISSLFQNPKTPIKFYKTDHILSEQFSWEWQRELRMRMGVVEMLYIDHSISSIEFGFISFPGAIPLPSYWLVCISLSSNPPSISLDTVSLLIR